jgi:hypothetical protein
MTSKYAFACKVIENNTGVQTNGLRYLTTSDIAPILHSDGNIEIKGNFRKNGSDLSVQGSTGSTGSTGAAGAQGTTGSRGTAGSDGGGGGTYEITRRAIVGGLSMAASDTMVQVFYVGGRFDSMGHSATITLPQLSACASGKVFILKTDSANSGVIAMITPYSGDLIDNSSAFRSISGSGVNSGNPVGGGQSLTVIKGTDSTWFTIGDHL